jgi:hypothetical protein
VINELDWSTTVGLAANWSTWPRFGGGLVGISHQRRPRLH